MVMKLGVKIMPQDKGSGNPMSNAYNTLPNSKKMVNGEEVGIQASGYLDKKGTPDGAFDQFNFLPPGQNIEKQSIADIRPMEMKTITPLGYPGDGWDE